MRETKNLKENKQFNMSQFLSPGEHYFFFIKWGRHFMLSRNFLRKQYKETNISMNYINVSERGWQIEKPLVDRDTEWRKIIGNDLDEEESFDKANSVFKTYRVDTITSLERMFENDFKLTKIPKIIKDKDIL